MCKYIIAHNIPFHPKISDKSIVRFLFYFFGGIKALINLGTPVLQYGKITAIQGGPFL